MITKRGKAAGITMLAVLCSLNIVIGVKAETYEYDNLKRLKKMTYDTGEIVIYEYDANGNMKSVTKTKNLKLEPKMTRQTQMETKQIMVVQIVTEPAETIIHKVAIIRTIQTTSCQTQIVLMD